MNTKSLRYLTFAMLLCMLAGISGDVRGQTGENPNIAYLSFIRRDPKPINSRAHYVDGNTSCTITYAPFGDLLCWGESLTGLEGDALHPQSPVPVEIPVPDKLMSLSLSRDFACYVAVGGSTKCWGKNGSGQLGNNTFDDSLSPEQVTGFAGGIIALDTGDDFACAGTWNGVLFCWGKGDKGQLGIGDRYNTNDPGIPTPKRITGLSGRISSIAAGAAHACAVVDDKLWCWGSNDHGQIGAGEGSAQMYHEPVQVQGLSEDVWEVYAGGNTTCAFAGIGLFCWGDNEFGQVGNGTSGNIVPSPAYVLLSGGFPTEVSVGRTTTCAGTMSNTLFCWGSNDQGQIGNGQTGGVFDTPQQVTDFGEAGGVSVGDGHTCASTWSYTVLCWGDNQFGQLGDGTTDDRLTPGYVVR